MSRTFATVAIVASTAIGSAAWATHGGPEVAGILGWDPKEEKVFCLVEPIDESGRAGRVLYTVLGSSSKTWQVVGWSRADEGDSLYDANLRRLKSRLRPLEPLLRTSMLNEKIVSRDTLRTFDSDRPRFRVMAAGGQTIDGWLDVTTIQDPEVRVIHQYRVPGRREIVGVVSFMGIPWEIGYEVQRPILIPGINDTLRVEWKPLD